MLEASDGRLVVVGTPEPPAHHHCHATAHEPLTLAGLSWNPVDDLGQLTEFPFMVHALEAGTIVAVMAGRGRLVHGAAPPDLRRSHALGDRLPRRGRRDPRRAAARARLLRRLRRRGAGARRGQPPAARRQGGESAAIGAVQAFGLGLGFLFVSLYSGQLGDLESLLFGTFLGITAAQVQTLLWVALAALAVLAAIGTAAAVRLGRRRRRPRRGRADRRCSALAFLLLLGLAVAATAEITGALLVFALLVTPPRPRSGSPRAPARGLALSVALALARDLARPRDRLLLALPGRLLGHEPLLRPLRRRARLLGGLLRSRRQAVRGGGLMLAHEFMRNAYLAGTFIALACGLVG